MKYKAGEWVRVFDAQGDAITALYDGQDKHAHRVKVQAADGSWRTWYLQEERFVK